MAILNLPQSRNQHGEVDTMNGKPEGKLKQCKCGVLPLLLSGTTLFTIALLSIKFTFFDMILMMRLDMRPGSPLYEIWLNPKPEVQLNVYIFTVDNSDDFLNGIDVNLKIKEIGPIVYREYLRHEDVVFHENSTLSYTSIRWAEFLPHANEPNILNKTIIVPNFSILAAAGYINDANMIFKMGFNMLHRTSNENVFMNISIYDYLWNYKSTLLQKAYNLAPFMVPTLNYGILHGIYNITADRYNVRIGRKFGNSQFFFINTINGAPTVPGYDISKGDCLATLVNSSEGAMYRLQIAKETVLWFWRKAICRKVPLYYEKEFDLDGIHVHKYSLRTDMYDRLANKSSDCYKGTNVELQDGLSDVSKCFFDMPFAASNPHFYGREQGFKGKLEGLNAKEERHNSYTTVEPSMGIPLVQRARSQMNLVMPVLSGFHNEYKLFSDMIVPLFWVEYAQNDLTPDIKSSMNFVLKVLPIVQYIVTFGLIFLGIGLAVRGLVLLISSKRKLYSVSEKSTEKSQDSFL